MALSLLFIFSQVIGIARQINQRARPIVMSVVNETRGSPLLLIILVVFFNYFLILLNRRHRTTHHTTPEVKRYAESTVNDIRLAYQTRCRTIARRNTPRVQAHSLGYRTKYARLTAGNYHIFFPTRPFRMINGSTTIWLLIDGAIDFVYKNNSDNPSASGSTEEITRTAVAVSATPAIGNCFLLNASEKKNGNNILYRQQV